MKLLIDQNLSPSLVRRLADLFPDSVHAFALHLGEADDAVLWEYAIENCSASKSAELLRKHSATIHTFAADDARGFLEIF